LEIIQFLMKRLLIGDFYEPSSIFMKDFPIPTATELEKKEIEILVQKCLDAKKPDPKADTTVLEKEIDQLVYQLYGLTEEENEISPAPRGGVS
jgi:adenine-specific DNA-methyltransferase